MPHKAQQIKSGLLYVLATVIDSVVPLLTLPIFSRILSVDDYGALALAQVYAVIVAGVANFSLNSAYNRNYFEYCEDKIKSGELFYSTISFVGLLSLLFGGLTYGFRHVLSQYVIRTPGYENLLFWSYVQVCLVNLRVYFLLYLRNVERPKQYISNTILFSILNLTISIVLVLVLHQGVLGVVMGQVVAAIIVLVRLLVQLLQELPFGYNKKILKATLKIGSPMVPMVFFSVVSNHFDKYMLGLLSSIGNVGTYSIGQKIAVVIHTFMTALQNVFSPTVFKKMFENKSESPSEIGKYLLPFFYIVVFGAMSMSIFSEEILWVFVPPQFYGAADIISLLTIFYVVLFFAKINADQLVYAHKTYLITFLIVGAGLLNVIFNIPFIHQWGAMGAASATVLSRFLVGILIFVVAQKFYRIQWPVEAFARVFVVFCFSSLTLIFLRHWGVTYMLRLGFKMITLGIYLYVGYTCRILTKDNMKVVFALLRGQVAH